MAREEAWLGSSGIVVHLERADLPCSCRLDVLHCALDMLSLRSDRRQMPPMTGMKQAAWSAALLFIGTSGVLRGAETHKRARSAIVKDWAVVLRPLPNEADAARLRRPSPAECDRKRPPMSPPRARDGNRRRCSTACRICLTSSSRLYLFRSIKLIAWRRYVLTMVLFRPAQFRWTALASLISVVLGACTYSV
jgi:hypothetical protein